MENSKKERLFALDKLFFSVQSVSNLDVKVYKKVAICQQFNITAP